MNKMYKFYLLLILILITCWLGYFYTEEFNVIPNTTRSFNQQLFRFIWLVVIGVLTFLAFSEFNKKWISLLIGVLYLVCIIVLGIVGVLDYKLHLLTENLKEAFSGIRLFFSSPLPFIILWLLNQIDLNSKSKKGSES